MKIVGVIQARMGSRRLPGKVMVPLGGRPSVWHILDRLRRVNGIERYVLATSSASENEPLVAWAESEGIEIVRHKGDDDIAGRLAAAIRIVDADIMVKVNADCPMVDPQVIATALEIFLSQRDIDAVTNKMRRTYPLGLSVELLGRKAIEWCDANLKGMRERELTVQWIFENRDRFKVISLEAEEDYSKYDLTLDTPEDYALIARLFKALYVKGSCFGWDEIKAHLSENDNLHKAALMEGEAAA